MTPRTRKTKQMAFRLRGDLYDTLGTYAEKLGTTRSDLIHMILEHIVFKRGGAAIEKLAQERKANGTPNLFA